MRKFTMLCLTLLLGCGLPSAVVAKGKTTKEIIVSGNKQRGYYLFAPEKLSASKPLPLIVLLHGSGRNGMSLVEKWDNLADKEQLILVAPDSINSAQWTFGADGPDLLGDLVEELKAKYPVDPRRVYLFGHSAGAIFTLMIGLIESEYFAAAAIHAGALRPDDYKFFDYAKRKIPVALFVGDRDPLFPLNIVKATRDAFSSRSFPVEFTEIPNHNHWYYDRASKINEQIWAFLKQHALAGDPHFERYQINK
jgi:poly(3-hydroxybutyrate) depolymerase